MTLNTALSPTQDHPKSKNLKNFILSQNSSCHIFKSRVTTNIWMRKSYYFNHIILNALGGIVYVWQFYEFMNI